MMTRPNSHSRSSVLSFPEDQTDVRSQALSALLDGELNQLEAESALRAFTSDETSQASVRVYALAAEAMRSSDPVILRPMGRFHDSVMAAIAAEPPLRAAVNSAEPAARSGRQQSWSLMAASVAAVGFVALVAQSLLSGPSSEITAAGAPGAATPVVVNSPVVVNPGPSWDTPRTVGLMRAHHAAPVLMLPSASDLEESSSRRGEDVR